MNNKKGNLQTLVPAMMILVLGAALLIFGLLMLSELKDNTITKTQTIVNETMSTVDEVGDQFSTVGACGFTGVSITRCFNGTSGTDINSGNYTVTTAGYLKFKAATDPKGFNNSNWNCTYSYNYGADVCTAANNTIIGLGKFADYYDLIVLAIIITIIISLLIAIFGMRKKA